MRWPQPPIQPKDYPALLELLGPEEFEPRVCAQHSYFTVHGWDERPLHQILSGALEQLRQQEQCPYELDDVLKKYVIDI